MTSNLPSFLRRTLRISYEEEEEEPQATVEADSHNNNNSHDGVVPTIMENSIGKSDGTAAASIAVTAETGVEQASILSTTTDKRIATVASVVVPPDDETTTSSGSSTAPSKGRAASLTVTTTDSHQQDNSSVPSRSTTTSSITKQPQQQQQPTQQKRSYREIQFDKAMSSNVVNMEELRKLCWNGIPPRHRALAWKILLGYIPTNQSRRQASLQRKRLDYQDAIQQHYEMDDNARTMQEQETLRQVLVDVPRTAPDVALFRNDRIRRLLSRLLYIWAMRHPASSYVQGINDLATPLIVVFLSEYYDGQDVLDGHVMNQLSDSQLEELEADVYGCLTNLLAGIQDHYTSDQPGVQRMVMRLEELVNRIDGDLCVHFREMGIEFIQFAFKWMNCLLLREFELPCIVRLWDTYLSEPDGFEGFHVYVCAAFLCQFSAQLQDMTFDNMFAFMQDIPTSDWTDLEIEMLLSQAYVLSTLFHGSDAHLIHSNNNNNNPRF